jgi:DNA-binding transcriptional ArsR family regulator
MKTIDIGGNAIGISAQRERALRILKEAGYVAKKSAFEEGKYRRYRTYILPTARAVLAELGIRITLSPKFSVFPHFGSDIGAQDLTRRERQFFKENPRCESVVSGSAKRINTILRKLDERYPPLH